MKIGISTSFFWKASDRIIEHLEKIKRSGFETIELDCHNMYHHMTPELAKRISDILKSGDISISSVHMPYQFPISSPDEKDFSAALASYEHLIEDIFPYFQKNFTEGPVLVFHPGVHADRISRDRQMKCFEKAVLRLDKAVPDDGRFVIAFENMLTSHFGCSKTELDAILSLARSVFKVSKTGICFDSCHCSYDHPAHDFLEKIAGEVVSTHLSDNYKQSDGEFHAIPMSLIHSRIDWRKVISILDGRLQTAIFELSKPPQVRSETYLKMAKAVACDLLTHLVPKDKTEDEEPAEREDAIR